MAFAQEGAKVAICGRDQQALDDTLKQLHDEGGQGVAIRADLSNAADCTRLVQEAATQLGGLQIVVNNAAVSADKAPRFLQDSTDAQIMGRVEGKLLPAVRISRAAIPHLRRSGGGRIVNIGGTAVRSIFRPEEVPVDGSMMPQGMGNAALANFSKHLANELAHDRIMVNIVHPHIARTERHKSRLKGVAERLGVSEDEAEAAIDSMLPIGRVIEVEDVAALVIFLASPLASAITGQSIAIDGGACRSIVY